MEQKKLDRLIAENQNTLYSSSPYLIQPVEKPIDLDGKPYPFGTPASLPNITCIGRFASLQPVRNKNKDFSELIVIWYQDEFAFPIDPIVVKELQLLDWERFADDFEY
jgi:hypothetical protein